VGSFLVCGKNWEVGKFKMAWEAIFLVDILSGLYLFKDGLNLFGLTFREYCIQYLLEI
jgi:hypothetical protein